MTLTILFFILKCLPVVAGFKLYDLYRTRWHYANTPIKRERYSKLWHAIGFWTVLITAGIIAFDNLPLQLIIDYAALAAVVVWILYDLAWNYYNRESVFYPGNGGGSFTEIIFKWLGDHVGFDLRFWTMITKVLFFLGALIWAFRYNL